MRLFLKRLINFKIYLGTIIFVSLILTILAGQYQYFFFDLIITKQIQLINQPLLDELLRFVTWLGNFQQSIFSLVIVAGALLIYGYRKESLMILLSALGAVSISESLKILVSRPRPDSLIVHQVEKFFKNDSFPSGHVLFFMGFYGFLLFLAYVKIKKKSVRNFLIGGLLGLIILVGISRIYLGSHWFSDVIAAYLIGSLWLYLMILIYHYLVRKSTRKN